MIGFLIQFFFFFFIVIFQISFLNATSSHLFPNVILATAIAWTLTRGFFAAWPWVVCLGFMYDMLSMDVAGISAIALVIFSYGISFISRRFLLEHRESGMVVAVLFMAVASVSYLPLLWIVRHIVLGAPWSEEWLANYFSAIDPMFGIGLNAVMLVAVYAVVSRINLALNFYDDRVTVKR